MAEFLKKIIESQRLLLVAARAHAEHCHSEVEDKKIDLEAAKISAEDADETVNEMEDQLRETQRKLEDLVAVSPGSPASSLPPPPSPPSSLGAPSSPAAAPSRKRPSFFCYTSSDESSDEVDEGGLPPRKRRRVECPPGPSGQEMEGERREEERPAKQSQKYEKTGPWHPSWRIVDQDDVDFHVTETDPIVRVQSFTPDLEDLDAYWHVETAGKEEEGAGPSMPEDPLQDDLPVQVDAEPVALVAPVPVVAVPVAPVLAAPAPGPMRVRRRKVRPTPSGLPRRSCRLAARRQTDDRVYYVTRSGRSVRPPDRFTP